MFHFFAAGVLYLVIEDERRTESREKGQLLTEKGPEAGRNGDKSGERCKTLDNIETRSVFVVGFTRYFQIHVPYSLVRAPSVKASISTYRSAC